VRHKDRSLISEELYAGWARRGERCDRDHDCRVDPSVVSIDFIGKPSRRFKAVVDDTSFSLVTGFKVKSSMRGFAAGSPLAPYCHQCNSCKGCRHYEVIVDFAVCRVYPCRLWFIFVRGRYGAVA